MENIFYIISIFFILSGILCSILILAELFPNRRQPMKIMEAVWPLTGLWASWVGLYTYWKLGRVKKQKPTMNMPATSGHNMPMTSRSRWQSILLSTLHCGAGCTLADLLGETFTSFIPIAIGSSLLAGQWVLDYILALILGIYFQYAAIHPMEPQLSRRQTIGKAFKIDFFSLTAWQIGMYGWMAIVMFVLRPGRPLPHNSWEFWFMMQIAMFFGFFTSYPANWLLIKMGIKKGM